MLSVLRYILRFYTKIGSGPPRCNNTVETLLSASNFEKLGDRAELLMMAARLQPDPPELHLRAEIAHRLSVVFRALGRISDSMRIITDFFDSQRRDPNQVSDHLLGLLHLSQANNQAYRFNFGRAREESRKWCPSHDNLSDAEFRLLYEQMSCTGRILKGEGRFDEARLCFEGCLAIRDLPRPKRRLLASHLSDVYCELDYIYRNSDCQSVPPSTYLERGSELVHRELRACRKPSKGYQRLLLSLIEIEIRQDHLDRAEQLISELLGTYSKIAEPDINERVGHVRTLVARARVSQLPDAEGHWIAALLQNRTYNPQENEVFTCGVIYLFISYVRLQLEDLDGFRAFVRKAVEVLRRERRQFLIPGVGTYLFDTVRSDLQSKTGWIVPDIQ